MSEIGFNELTNFETKLIGPKANSLTFLPLYFSVLCRCLSKFG